ncbi:hypothetical protein [Halomarina oriensis]|uniref:Phage tail protein n=1 Tax=Halomarina oriensis TaxID=671145 RepID=A0A6B0GS09_9EURY|nr:hypothetical protein [Halomarina oriensis]MWG36459.1 hypothetical protein [Halomarina oriensis]
MVAYRDGGVQESKQYDPTTSAIIVGGTAIADVAEMSVSGEKDRTREDTVDRNAITDPGVPRVEASVTVYVTSVSTETFKQLCADDVEFDVNFKPSDDAGMEPTTLLYCMVDDWEHTGVSPTGVPEFEATINGYDYS